MTISDLTQKYFCCVGHKSGDFAESERAAKETIAIPIYSELTPAQQTEVVEILSPAKPWQSRYLPFLVTLRNENVTLSWFFNDSEWHALIETSSRISERHTDEHT